MIALVLTNRLCMDWCHWCLLTSQVYDFGNFTTVSQNTSIACITCVN